MLLMFKKDFNSNTQKEKIIVNLPGSSILMMLLITGYVLLHSKWNRWSNLYFVKIIASHTEILWAIVITIFVYAPFKISLEKNELSFSYFFKKCLR